MKKSLIFLLLILSLFTKAQDAKENEYHTHLFPNQSNDKVHVTMYSRKYSWGMGQQFYGMKIQNLTSKKLKIKGYYYARLTCGNRATANFSITLKPKETLGGESFIMDNTGLTASAESEQCAGQAVYQNGQKIGITRIMEVGFQFNEVTIVEDEEKKTPAETQRPATAKPQPQPRKENTKETDLDLAQENVNKIAREHTDNVKEIDALIQSLAFYRDAETIKELNAIRVQYAKMKDAYSATYTRCLGQLNADEPVAVNDLLDVQLEGNGIVSDLRSLKELAPFRRQMKSASGGGGVGDVLSSAVEGIGSLLNSGAKRDKLFYIEDGYIGLAAGYEAYLGGTNAPYKSAINTGFALGSMFGGSTFLWELKASLGIGLEANKEWVAGVFGKNAGDFRSIKPDIAIGLKLSPMLVPIQHDHFVLAFGPGIGGNAVWLPKTEGAQYTHYYYNDVNQEKIFITYGAQIVAFTGNTFSFRVEYSDVFNNTLKPGIQVTGSPRVSLEETKVKMGTLSVSLAVRLFQNN